MKRSRKQLRALLASAGAREVAMPNAEFVSNLEHRLLNGAPDALPAMADERPLRRARLVLLPAAAMIAAIVVAGAFTSWFDGGAPRKFELGVAKDTVVELPDGSEVEGENGLDLPDGSVVKTGPNGSASLGNVDLGPGQVATVESDKITVSSPTTAPTEPTTLPPLTIPTITIPTLPPLTIPTVPGVPLP